MGFMDTLRSMKNAMTGGGAKVQLDVGTPVRGMPLAVQVKAIVGDADLKIDKVYVHVEGIETIEMEVAVKTNDAKETVNNNTERRSQEASTYHQEVVLTGAQMLNAKQEYTWEGTVQLPESVLPTYKGVNAKHEWRLAAGLSTVGNDPDSGWVTIEIK